MRRLAALLMAAVGFGGFLASLGAGAALAQEEGPHGAIVTIDGIIDPVSARFLSRSIEAAEEEGAQLLVVFLDTPGGLLDATREMVEAMLTADVPVVVYVYPPGARAASAGTFLLAAAHVAAMSPGSNVGAASPVGPSGEDLPETLKGKATQDAAAFIRSIAIERGRNAEALEATVLSAASYTATEALEAGIIDLIVDDVGDLLARLDGRTVQVGDRQVVLQTAGLPLREVSRTPVERFLGFLANPNVAFLLLSLGGLGIMVEIFNPGGIFPGLLGVVALALAFVALGNLPVNWVGVALIALAMVLFYMELQAPGVGIFGIGGAVTFLLGAFLLFGGLSPPPIPSPSFRVSLWAIGAVGVVLFGMVALMYRMSRQARREAQLYEQRRGRLVGRVGRTTTALDPRGTVQVAGELWSAVSDSGETIPAGEEVIVEEVEGLTLKVFRASGTGITDEEVVR